MTAAAYLTAEQHAQRLTDCLRLAKEIADDAARSDIECFGVPHGSAGKTWWFVGPREGQDPYETKALERSVRYLTMRDRLARHESQPHLVRIKR